MKTIFPDIVIPVAGLGRRMNKGHSPKALISLDGETVLARQIRLLRNGLPGSRLIVVAGYEATRIKDCLPRDAKVVINREYETTNVGYSVAMGLERVKSQAALVVYGDLVFDEDMLTCLQPALQWSSVLVDHSGRREDEVGVNVFEKEALYFSYGMPIKWGQIAVLHPKERNLYVQVANEDFRKRHFGYEIFNEILERGGKLRAIEMPFDLRFAEIDCSRDIERARLLGH